MGGGPDPSSRPIMNVVLGRHVEIETQRSALWYEEQGLAFERLSSRKWTEPLEESATTHGSIPKFFSTFEGLLFADFPSASTT